MKTHIAASPPRPPAHRGWRVPGICILLAAMVWIVFGQTLGHDFVGFDDNRYVYENPYVSRGITGQGIAWAFTHSHGDNWHPLTSIMHMLDCQAYGLQPWGHHLTNVLLHGAAAILLFLALLRMTGAPWRCAFAAALFAVHPLRVESVAWVSELKDGLSGVFFMLTLLAYTRYSKNTASSRRYFAVVALFALGLMCKPTLVTLPFALLLLDYWPLERFPADPGGRNVFFIPRPLIAEKIPFFVLTLFSCIATVLAQRKAIVITDKLPFADRIGNALVSYAIYLKEMVFPAGLVVLHPHPANHLALWEVVLAILVLGSISAGVLAFGRSHPYLLTGWLWYLGMLVPMIGLVQVGWQAHADRYTYLPQIGLSIAIAWMAGDLCAKKPELRIAAWVAGPVTIAALMWCAWLQTSYWRDSESLWNRTLQITADNDVVENGLGAALAKNGRVDEAIPHYQRALAFNPGSSEAHYNLGMALQQKGLAEEAAAHYQKTIELEPDSAGARNNLGTIFLQKGGMDRAIACYREAVGIDPDYAEAHSNLGFALHQEGRLDEAIPEYQTALKIKPDMPETRLNLGIAFQQKGETAKALEQFEQAVNINPDSSKAQNDLGLALLQSGNVNSAIPHFQRALEIEPGYAAARSNLDLALRQKEK